MEDPMQKPTTPAPSHKPSELILERLSTYAVTATAAGVSVLTVTQPAEAKVVYTPANTQILGFVPLDLNHDQITDFFLVRSGSSRGRSGSGWLSASPLNTNNRVLGHGTVQFLRKDATVAFDLPPGFEVGPKPKGFQPGGKKLLAGYWFFLGTGGSSSKGFAGRWANGGQGVTNRYLGLAFEINGLVHFGWARITVTGGGALISTLTGYAYETIPNKPIVTGVTHDETSAAALSAPGLSGKTESQPALPMLGALALGCDGLAIWRREEGQSRLLNPEPLL
jgi:hypothetical protein